MKIVKILKPVLVSFSIILLSSFSSYGETVRICDAPEDGGACRDVERRSSQDHSTQSIQNRIRSGNENPDLVNRVNRDGNTSDLTQGCEKLNAKNETSLSDTNLYRCRRLSPTGSLIGNSPLDGGFFTDSNQQESISTSLITFSNGVYLVNTDVARVDLDGVPSEFNCNPANGLTENQCMVCNCFYESRSTTFEEMVMVNKTVLTRAMEEVWWFPRNTITGEGRNSNPTSVCGVVFDPGSSGSGWSWQYSWTNPAEGLRSRKIGYGSDLNNIEMAAYGKCVSAVDKSLETRGTYFSTQYLTPAARENQTWDENCEAMAPPITVGPVTGVRLDHEFFPYCDAKERALYLRDSSAAPASSSTPPATSLRPSARPRTIDN